MNIDENQKIELFNKFYNWLKADGLKPLKSERLHRKKVFSSLINNCPMTIDNFKDFLFDRMLNEIKNLKSQIINYDNKNIFIDEIEIFNLKEEFILINRKLNINLKCKFSQLKDIKKRIILCDL